jgi:hypothetical protein
VHGAERSNSNNAVVRVGAALVISVALFAQAQPPTLAGVLERAAAYVAEFERLLTAIAADETYEQLMGIPGRRGEFIATTRRRLTARFVLFRDGDEGYLVRRDVIEVDGVPAGDRTAGSRARVPDDLSRWSQIQRNQLRDDNARYNIGDIVEAEVTVSFKSQPLLGLLPPVEMHERYRARGPSQTIVEASAAYGPFYLLK